MPNAPIDLHLPFQTRVDAALKNKYLKSALSRATSQLAAQSAEAMVTVDGETLRKQVREMKESVLRNLPDLLETLTERLTENGAVVHWARDAAEANALILDLAHRANVRKVVKNKSVVTEEMALNTALEEAGIKTIEGDFGDYINQLNHEPSSHPLSPLIHRRIEDIVAIMQRQLDMPPTLDPEAMYALVRGKLRQEFLTADMGISGCNFAIAETGTICIATNEGSGRLAATLPRLYVAVMGIEEVVPTVEDAFLQYQAFCRSATGQPMSAYLSMSSGPRKAGDVDGPQEFHVVLLDNGRNQLLADGYGEALLCIHCGACLNVCPVYREVGGHVYGGSHSGPIGALLNPLLPLPVTDANKLPHASTLCGACRDVCPVKIDLPQRLLDLRGDQVAAGNGTLFDRIAIKRFVQTMKSRSRYENSGKLASISSMLLASGNGGTIKFLPPPLASWTESRDFPPFARKSFRDLWRERKDRRHFIR